MTLFSSIKIRLMTAFSNPGVPASQAIPNSQGLTLVECIMAIVVVGLTGAAIAPMMVVSVATRVQSQKAEQAIEVAQGEIDRVRSVFERNTTTPTTGLPPVVTVTGNLASKVPGPTALTDTTIVNAAGVDVDRDGTADFAVQSYLVEKANAANAYDMGVRVYDFSAVQNKASGTMPIDEARLGTTASQGERRQKPLAVLYTNIAISERNDSMCDFIDYTAPAGQAYITQPASCN